MLGLFEGLVEMPVLRRLHGFFKVNMVCLVSLRFVDSFFPPDSYVKSQTKINANAMHYFSFTLVRVELQRWSDNFHTFERTTSLTAFIFCDL